MMIISIEKYYMEKAKELKKMEWLRKVIFRIDNYKEKAKELKQME